MSAFTKLVRKDLEFGFKSENKLLPILEESFNVKLSKTKEFSVFDYVDQDEKIMIELKTRRNTLKKYPTTMVGYNKFKKGYELIEEGYKIYFVFAFSDITAYYQLQENNFKIQKGGRKDRGRNEIKQYVYIPISELIIFENKNPILDIAPTMTNPEAKTPHQKPLSYSKRLINEFENQKQGTFNFDDIKKLITEFSTKEYEKRKGQTDIMPFGKYKFKKVSSIAKFDKQYLQWLVKQTMMEGFEELREEINKYI